MRNATLLLGLSLISFLAGLAMQPSSRAEKSVNQQVVSVSSPTPCPDNEFSKLIDDQHVTKFNGEQLKLDYDPETVEIPASFEEAKVTPLNDGGLLVKLEDTLYRLDNQRRVKWEYTTAQRIFDYAYVESTNSIYGTAGDNIMFILNATSGKDEHVESRNGSAWYGVAEKYGDDMCLVTDWFRWYRERDWDLGLEPIKDGITCWRGTKKLWHMDFPPDADLVVRGKRILAVTKSKKGIYVNEIIPPQTKGD